MRVCDCSLNYEACKEHAPIILSSVAWLDLTYFSALSHKRHDFQKKKLLDIKFVFFVQLLSKTFFFQEEFSKIL
jgi:hypothetical protein